MDRISISSELTVSLFVSDDVDPQLTCFTAPPRADLQHLSRSQVSESPGAAVDRDSSRTSSVTGAPDSRWRSSWSESGPSG